MNFLREKRYSHPLGMITNDKTRKNNNFLACHYTVQSTYIYSRFINKMCFKFWGVELILVLMQQNLKTFCLK